MVKLWKSTIKHSSIKVYPFVLHPEQQSKNLRGSSVFLLFFPPSQEVDVTSEITGHATASFPEKVFDLHLNVRSRCSLQLQWPIFQFQFEVFQFKGR